MKYLLIIIAAVLLSSAAPSPSALPRAVVHVPPRAAVVVPRQPAPTPAVTIAGTVDGFTSGGSPAPIGAYTAYGATLAEATINAQALEADVRARATAQAVRP